MRVTTTAMSASNPVEPVKADLHHPAAADMKENVLSEIVKAAMAGTVPTGEATREENPTATAEKELMKRRATATVRDPIQNPMTEEGMRRRVTVTVKRAIQRVIQTGKVNFPVNSAR